MAILSGIAVLNCQNIENTLAFYQQIFQFVIVKKRENEQGLRWIHLMHGSTTLMLQQIDKTNADAESKINSSISLYFYVNEIKDLHHFINVNYDNVSSLKSTDYQMQEFTLNDPEGNVITVGSTTESVQFAEL